MRGKIGVWGQGTMLLPLSSVPWVLVVTQRPLHSRSVLALLVVEQKPLHSKRVLALVAVAQRLLHSKRVLALVVTQRPLHSRMLALAMPPVTVCFDHLAAGLQSLRVL